METTHVAAIEALLGSINPAASEATQLNANLKDAIDLVGSMSYHAASVRRAYYGSLAKAFDRIRENGKGEGIDFDLKNLKMTMFGSDVEIEAIRLLRADAIISIKKSSAALASKMSDEVRELQASEKSSTVRDRLAELR